MRRNHQRHRKPASIFDSQIYFNDFRDSLNAEFAAINAGYTFAATRSAANPSTVIDENGLLTLQTTSDVPRRPRGYRDGTGFHASRGGALGLLMEGASTQLCQDNYFSQITGFWTAVLGGDGTAAIAADTTYPNPYGGGQILKFTGTKVDDVCRVDTTKLFSVTAGSVYTGWFLMRGTGTVVLRFSDGAAQYSDSIILANDQWYLHSFKVTAASSANASWGVRIPSDNAVTCYIALASFTAGAYPQSFIPNLNTAAGVTRNAESLTIPLSKDFGVTGKGVSFDGSNDKATFGSWGNLAAGSVAFRATLRTLSGGTWRGVLCASNDGSSFEVLSYGDGKIAFFQNSFSETVTTNIPHDIILTWGDGNIKAYVDNVLVGSGANRTVNWSAPQFGSYNSGYFADMIVYKAVVFNRVITESERTAPFAIANRTGIVAEYLFTDGTGTSLTDTAGTNTGSISGATWTGDTHDFTLALAYYPVMLPLEQPATGFSNLFRIAYNATNDFSLLYYGTTDNKVEISTYSNGNYLVARSAALTTWTRFSKHVIIVRGSTTSFIDPALNSGNPIRMALYDNGTAIAYSTTYVPPVGALPATFSIQSSAGQAAIFEQIRMFSRVGTPQDVQQIYSECLK